MEGFKVDHMAELLSLILKEEGELKRIIVVDQYLHIMA